MTDRPFNTVIEWGAWRSVIDRNHRAGWAVAAFPVCTERRTTDFMVGAVNDLMGVYSVSGTYQQIKHDTGALSIDEGKPGTFLVHLRTGAGVGLFEEYDHAILAGELANRIDAWRITTALGDPAWCAACALLGKYLFDCGLILDDAMRFSANAAVHSTIHRVPEVLFHGRPEKLS
jgi:hypothetical protein